MTFKKGAGNPPKKKMWKVNKKNRLGGQSLQSRRKFFRGSKVFLKHSA
jgi:hypothetical protein